MQDRRLILLLIGPLSLSTMPRRLAAGPVAENSNPKVIGAPLVGVPATRQTPWREGRIRSGKTCVFMRFAWIFCHMSSNSYWAIR